MILLILLDTIQHKPLPTRHYKSNSDGLSLSDSSIVFEGATDDEFQTTLAIIDPTADRTITFPDDDGTAFTSIDITGNAATATALATAINNRRTIF